MSSAGPQPHSSLFVSSAGPPFGVSFFFVLCLQQDHEDLSIHTGNPLLFCVFSRTTHTGSSAGLSLVSSAGPLKIFNSEHSDLFPPTCLSSAGLWPKQKKKRKFQTERSSAGNSRRVYRKHTHLAGVIAPPYPLFLVAFGMCLIKEHHPHTPP